ncbi:MAG: tetratricopeptide repeat protein, partial [Acidimicrobiia bacterium]
AGTIDSEQVQVLQSALAAIPATDSPMRARLLAALAAELFWAGDHAERKRLSDEALGIARRLSDPSTSADVLSARIIAVMAPDTLEERLANTTELLDVSRQLGDPAVAHQAWWVRARSVVETGDVDEAQRAIDAANRCADETGQPGLRFVPAWIGAGLALFAGRMEDAERLTAAILEVGQLTGQRDARQYHALAQFQLRLEQGRLDEVEESFTKLSEDFPGLVFVRPMLALLHCELGQYDEARARLDALMARDLRDLPLDSTWLKSVADCAAVAARLGDAKRAEVLSELLAPYADRLVAAGGPVIGFVSHYLGLLCTTLRRWEAAENNFSVSDAAHQRAQAPAWLARTRTEQAAMHLRRGRPDDVATARHLLEGVLSTATDLGFVGVDRRARALLTEADA